MNRRLERLRSVAGVVLFGAAFGAQALDLMEAYRLARTNDPAFAAAAAERDAGLEARPQALSALLPQVSGELSTNDNHARSKTFGGEQQFNTNRWAVGLTQPLFDAPDFLRWQKSDFTVQQVEAVYGEEQQNLALRVAQAYFEVLGAQDSLEFARANKTSISEQLAQAKRNFEVGTATITDTNEAQARYDLAFSQELAAANQVEIARRALNRIIGEQAEGLAPLRGDLRLDPPEPNDMEQWVNAAIGGNWGIRASRAAYEGSIKEVQASRAGHLPVLEANARYDDSTTENPFLDGSTNSFARREQTTSTYGLRLVVPIYSGGMTSSVTREAVALKEKSRNDLEAARRTAEFDTRQAFLNVNNGRAQVQALEQALISSETALESNRVGYEVGVRINIDVLNSQQQVFQTRRDLARARYETIMNSLRLAAAAGTLTEQQIESVNRLLASGVTTTTPTASNGKTLKGKTGNAKAALPARATRVRANVPVKRKTP